MTIHAKIAGWSGIVAGLGLAVEGALWTLSGWTADTFTDPASAIDFLREDGAMLRAAVFVGLLNLVFAVVFVAGLAGRIRGRAPIAAAATLWFGMIGIALHLIVPFGHWYGVPAFVDAADRDATAAQSAWTAFTVVLDAAGGAANLFLGLSMLAAGWAAVARRALPAGFGWVALIAGTATAVTIFAPDTPLTAVAGAVFMPSLLLSVVVRIWGGIALTQAEPVTDPIQAAAPPR
ncbi:DUF4386 family protein [Haloactinopolyspora sp.]|uniref:DUF4386 family protein n=1 Tax=Haloactinopolyspora sp. TaxID=1966353 RepID=UPI0026304B66|nr:DUF4386 family protein [Haloactinopolyspora sp.]